MSAVGRAFEAGTWPPEMNMLEPTINVLLYLERPIDVTAMADALERHMWPSHRFSCCMNNGMWESRHSTMDRSYHVREVSGFADEAAVDNWVQAEMVKPLDKSFPIWRVTLFPLPPPHRSAMFAQIHHSIGDGLSLLFAFTPMISCEGGDPLSKVPLPNALLPPERRKVAPKEAKASSGSKGGCCKAPCDFLHGALTPVLIKYDSEFSLNYPLSERIPFVAYNGSRRFTRFPMVSMSIVKRIKEKHHCSVNDVLMAVLVGALRRYGAEVRGDMQLKAGGGRLEFKSIVMIGLPRPIDESNLAGGLTNKMLFVSCPLPIDEPTPLGRLERTIAAFNNLKSPSYIAGMAGLTSFVNSVAPTSVLRKTASEVFSKHSVLVTNVPSFSVPVKIPEEQGSEMREMHMVFPNIIPQVSMITYNGHVCCNIVADPGLYPQPEALSQIFVEEFDVLENA